MHTFCGTRKTASVWLLCRRRSSRYERSLDALQPPFVCATIQLTLICLDPVTSAHWAPRVSSSTTLSPHNFKEQRRTSTLWEKS